MAKYVIKKARPVKNKTGFFIRWWPGQDSLVN